MARPTAPRRQQTPPHVQSALRSAGFSWRELDTGDSGWMRQLGPVQVSVWLGGPGGGYGMTPPKSMDSPVEVYSVNENTGKETRKDHRTLRAFLALGKPKGRSAPKPKLAVAPPVWKYQVSNPRTYATHIGVVGAPTRSEAMAKAKRHAKKVLRWDLRSTRVDWIQRVDTTARKLERNFFDLSIPNSKLGKG